MKVSGKIAPFGLRMPKELKAFISEQANKNGRSMNAELLARVTQTMDSNIKGLDLADLSPESRIKVKAYVEDLSKLEKLAGLSSLNSSEIA